MYNDKKSGSQLINLKVILELSKNVQIEFGNEVEISLDCFMCESLRRTINICEKEEFGICIKTKHKFPIKIISKQSNIENNLVEVIYQIEYWYSPFHDRKYKTDSQFLPTWGRISFKLVCPKCLSKKRAFLQTNIVRPWTNYCDCGNSFYTESKVFPIFEAPLSPN